VHMKRSVQRGLLVLAVVALAAAGCGGGGGGASAPAAPVAGSGILVDSPVAGVTYAATPSGKSGVTDSNGAYNFNVGDTVEFKLGTLVLGNVTATGIVTPTELAAGNSNKLSNLLVVLQSLDADGIPANGIDIPAAAAAAVSTAIDLTVAPATLNTSALQTAMTAGNIVTPIVTQANADAHYLAQGWALLGSNIWVGRPDPTNTNDSTFLLRFAANGEYLTGEAGSSSSGGMAGVEYGTATLNSFDVHGYKIPTPAITVDTNGQWGLSHPLLCDRWRSVGDQIIFTADFTTPATCANSANDGAASKAENNPTGIVGVWAFESPTVIKKLHIAFFSDGKYLMIDPFGDVAVPSCGGPGVEAGSYAYSGTQLTISNVTYNTNGCVGFFYDGDTATKVLPFVISPDGTTAELAGPNGDMFYRVSK